MKKIFNQPKLKTKYPEIQEFFDSMYTHTHISFEKKSWSLPVSIQEFSKHHFPNNQNDFSFFTCSSNEILRQVSFNIGKLYQIFNYIPKLFTCFLVH